MASSLHGGAGLGAGTRGDGRPTNEQIRRFSLHQLREEVVLPKTNKNRKSILDGGDLTPEDCLSYMRAVIDRVAVLQAEGAGRAASESEQQIVQGIKDAISAQIDVMNSSNVSEQLNAHKKELWKYVRKSIPTPKAVQGTGKLPVWGDFPSPASEAKPAAVGIDLGTTHSRVAVFHNDRVEIIEDAAGSRSIPSCVAFTDSGVLVGETAINEMTRNAANTIVNVQRIIGLESDNAFVQSCAKQWPFKVVTTRYPGIFLEVTFKGETKAFSPEEISAMVLTNLVQLAKSHLGTNVTQAVITVPSFFNSAQRHATKQAGAIAGLQVLRITSAPSVAALGYFVCNRFEDKRTILIFDFGGGKLDVSLVDIDDGIFEVLACAGNPHLGGEDFDSRVVSWCVQEFKRKHKKDLSEDKRALCRLRAACERAKRTLSGVAETTIEVDALFEGTDFYTKITRAMFEELCMDLFRATIDPVERVIRDSRVSKGSIHEIVLVGGSTRIPMVCQLLQDFFNGKQLNRDGGVINIHEATVHGAALQAAVLTGVQSEVVSDILLLDVTAQFFGIETAGGVMTLMVHGNSTIPCKKIHTFSTHADNQTSALIQVFEGQRQMTKDNRFVDKFRLDGIPPAPRGVPRIVVTFDIDANQTLVINAEVNASGSVQIFHPLEKRAGIQATGHLELEAENLQLVHVEETKAPGGH